LVAVALSVGGLNYYFSQVSLERVKNVINFEKSNETPITG
jgi:hypothetical protein